MEQAYTGGRQIACMGEPDPSEVGFIWQDGRGNTFLGSELYGEDSLLSAEDTGGPVPERWLLGGEGALAPPEEELASGASSNTADDPMQNTDSPPPSNLIRAKPDQSGGMAWGPTCFVHQEVRVREGEWCWEYPTWRARRECETDFPYCTSGRTACATTLAYLGCQEDVPAFQETEAHSPEGRRKRARATPEKEQEGEKET